MTWVTRASDRPPRHECDNPNAGQRGDLWRCDACGRLWQVSYACEVCHANGGVHRVGQCLVGTTWRPAGAWTRFRYRRHR